MSQLRAQKEAVRLEKVKKRAEKRKKEAEKGRKARESLAKSGKTLEPHQYHAIMRDPDLSTVRNWQLILAFKQVRMDLFKTLGTVERLEARARWERFLTVLWLAHPSVPLAEEDENTVT